mmetsp:Transcript_95444/g.269736  ORF Transcript_95444/g.269736 Transcript_95444/m.269736 type:complete len:310 (-) Transcript_95444:568-1497(-)
MRPVTWRPSWSCCVGPWMPPTPPRAARGLALGPMARDGGAAQRTSRSRRAMSRVCWMHPRPRSRAARGRAHGRLPRQRLKWRLHGPGPRLWLRPKASWLASWPARPPPRGRLRVAGRLPICRPRCGSSPMTRRKSRPSLQGSSSTGTLVFSWTTALTAWRSSRRCRRATCKISAWLLGTSSSSRRGSPSSPRSPPRSPPRSRRRPQAPLEEPLLAPRSGESRSARRRGRPTATTPRPSAAPRPATVSGRGPSTRTSPRQAFRKPCVPGVRVAVKLVRWAGPKRPPTPARASVRRQLPQGPSGPNLETAR